MTPARASHRSMSAVDVLMFRSEGHPRTRTAMLGLYVLDRAPPRDDFLAHIDQASRLFPRLRERVVEATTPLVDARWVTDPDFDLAYHVRRVHAPGAGAFRDVLDLVEGSLMAPLDTARPLWEFTLVEGLERDRAALITKLSHAITDGVGGMQMQSVLFDTEREPPPRPAEPEPIPVDLTAADITRAAVRRLPRTLAGTATGLVGGVIGGATRVAWDPMRTAERTAGYVRSLGRLLATPARPSPLLAGRSNSRRVLWAEVTLDDLKRAAKAVGGTVNDAYVATLAGALARYHDRLGVPVAAVSVAVPISRRLDGTGAEGNQWAPALISVPTGEDDAATRIRAIGSSLRAARSEVALDAISSLAPVLSRLPSALVNGPLANLAPRADVQASNVPGWPIDTYVCGAKVERFIGFGPLPGAAMMVVLLSSAGNCTIGVNYDPAAIERPDVFQTCLEESLDEVVTLGANRDAG
jgi:diacylglycerol O-acyltransferase / wax synthase